MQSQSVFAWDERQSQIQVFYVFIPIARLAGSVAKSGDTSVEAAIRVFKARKIVKLPAVDGYGDLVHSLQGGLRVHSYGSIQLLSGLIIR